MALLVGAVSFRVRRGKYFVTGVAKYLIVGESRERERLPKIAVSPCAGLEEGGKRGCKYCGVRHVPVRGNLEIAVQGSLEIAVQGRAPGSRVLV